MDLKLLQQDVANGLLSALQVLDLCVAEQQRLLRQQQRLQQKQIAQLQQRLGQPSSKLDEPFSMRAEEKRAQVRTGKKRQPRNNRKHRQRLKATEKVVAQDELDELLTKVSLSRKNGPVAPKSNSRSTFPLRSLSVSCSASGNRLRNSLQGVLTIMLPFILAGLVTFCLSTSVLSAEPNKPTERSFEFTYACEVVGVSPGKTIKLWLPVPSTSDEQTVSILARSVPAEGSIRKDATYGNEILYVEAPANAEGVLACSVRYKVTRKEVVGKTQPAVADRDVLARYLQADAKVPISGKPLDLLKGKTVPTESYEQAKLFYEVVNEHMKYSKIGTGWGQGDVLWACESKYGNCSDFHSLFISLCRAHKIPAKFEIGFPLPEKRGEGEIAGYHCWAKFKPVGKGWLPVDISEANKHPKLKEYYFGNLSADRVQFSVGRDLTLVPRQAGPARNFFVYPYAEVAGQEHTKIERKFTFKDLP